jgi:hypothetical protein
LTIADCGLKRGAAIARVFNLHSEIPNPKWGWRAAEESHPAGWFWRPPWSLDRGPSFRAPTGRAGLHARCLMLDA